MKKIIIGMIIAIMSLSLIQTTFAASTQSTTILPEGSEGFTDTQCMTMLATLDTSKIEDYKKRDCPGTEIAPCWETVLSCGIKTGDIHLWMIPYYIARIIEFLIAIAGLVSVFFTILGGYFYAWGGLTEDKEKGKKTVMYALIGLALASLAWIIVNIVQTTLTT